MDGVATLDMPRDANDQPCELRVARPDSGDAQPADSADAGGEPLTVDEAPESDAGETQAGQPPTPDAITPMQIVEAVLFAADTPLPGAKIAQALGVGDARDVRRHIAALNEKYTQIGATFRIQEISGGFQMLTLPVFNTWLARLHKARQETRLSAAAMETLAVVAYKQPVTRAEIESIRGVAAGEVLNRLRELDLVKIVGRAEDLGRPMLYGTTKRFLEIFGLGGLQDLPKLEDTMFAPKMKGAGGERPADLPAPSVSAETMEVDSATASPETPTSTSDEPSSDV
jgi:segregation and condensation protein B